MKHEVAIRLGIRNVQHVLVFDTRMTFVG